MKKTLQFLLTLLTIQLGAQVPVAGFTLSPNPVCSGAGNVITITDQSTNGPTSWGYTITTPGPNPVILSVQNPTVTFNFPGTYTITLIATNASGASAPVSKTVAVLPSPNGIVNPANVSSCINGNPVTLTIQPGGPGAATATFSWSTGATTQTIMVSPAVTTVYSVAVTGTNGCSVTRTATVTIGQPTVAVVSTPVSLCPGFASTLQATGSGLQPFSYTWSTSANTRTISTSVPGVYDVTVTNGSGCTSVQSYTLGSSAVLSISAIANPTVLCAGQMGVLLASGASNYTWSTGAQSPNTSASPTVTTTYTVAGSSGTCTGSGTVTLYVSNIPTITASASKNASCAGDTIQLNAAGATSYTWQPVAMNGNQISVTPNNTTTYVVTGNNPGCPSRTAAIVVTVKPRPVLNVSTTSTLICSGEIVAIGVSGASTYTWSNGSNAVLMLLTPASNLSLTVTGTDANNCTSSTAFTQSVSACENIAGNGPEAAFAVYPNPSNGNFIISGATGPVTVSSVSGQLVKAVNASEQAIEIHLPEGLYIVKDGQGRVARLISTGH